MMTDAPTQFGDYAPKDFDGAFQGAVTARDALRMSLNVPAVMVLDRVGPLGFTITLQNAGARLAFPAGGATPTLPVALGGLGISLADITMLYAGIANMARRGRCALLRKHRMRPIIASSARSRRFTSSRSCAAWRCRTAGRWDRA